MPPPGTKRVQFQFTLQYKVQLRLQFKLTFAIQFKFNLKLHSTLDIDIEIEVEIEIKYIDADNYIRTCARTCECKDITGIHGIYLAVFQS